LRVTLATSRGGFVLTSTTEIAAFSNVVEKIYDAAADASRWTDALSQIMTLVGASGSGMHFGDSSSPSQNPSNMNSIGFSDFFKSKLDTYAPIWALQCGLPFWNVGDVHHLPDILPREEFVNGRFYKDVIEPDGQLDYIGMVALKEGTRYAPFTLATKQEDGPFSKRSVELVRLLSPHICRSAKIGLALELKSLHASMLETTLDTLSASVFLVNRDGKVLFMNRGAERQVKRGKGISIVNNRLIPTDSTAAHIFAASFSRAEVPGDQIAHAPASIALPADEGGLVASLLPLENGYRQSLTTGPSPAAFAVFVQDPMAVPPIPGEGFAKLYGLTHAELRITLAMAPGLGPRDAADILGLSLPTVKTHLQKIFAKTGTKRQADLMQLLMRASAPVTS
jgi:DNA-binding CsgD family transcriptional regulator/PAS domain-containing protein